MNTKRAEKKEVGEHLLGLNDMGEGFVIRGTMFIPEDQKLAMAKEISRKLRERIYGPLGKLVILTFLLIPTSAHAWTDANLLPLTDKIIQAESSRNPRAVGDGGQSRGLMQIKEATWRRHTTEPWSRAFEPALNIEVGKAELRRIVLVYRSSGTEPSVAYVLFTYNTGHFIKHSLPKTLNGKLHPWTWNHPNLVYRAIYREALR